MRRLSDCYGLETYQLPTYLYYQEKHEKEIDDKIAGYEDGLDNIESVEQIDASITALGALSKEIGPDDARVDRINGIVNRYVSVYDNIVVDIVSNEPGRLTVRLVYNGNTITTTQKPRVSSNCAAQFSQKNDGDDIVISYNSDYCYEQDDNYIEVRFRFGSKFVKEKAYFKLK